MIENRPAPYFTGHLLRTGLQCPVKLYYKGRDYPEKNSIKPILQHAGFNKHFLKKLVCRQYPNAKLVSENSKREAIRATTHLLEQDTIIILDGAFSYQQCFARVPILTKSGAQIQLIDIQTNAFNPHKNKLTNRGGKLLKKWKRYIIDLAFKTHIIKSSYPEWRYELQLVLPDKTKKSRQDQLLQHLQNDACDVQPEDLFCRLDVTDYVNNLLLSETWNGRHFEEMLHELKERYFHPKWTRPPIGKKCQRCEFRIDKSQQEQGQPSGFDRCWKKSDKAPEYNSNEPPVLDLIGPGVTAWLGKEIYLQKNIPPADLPNLNTITGAENGISYKQRQSLQVRKTREQEIPGELIKQSIFDELQRWTYPLHFLDFEAGNYAVPIRRNRKPYHLVVFQFSCHTLYADGRKKHQQWISGNKGSYPNYELVRQLMAIPGVQQGTIIQYSTFEQYALKTIRKELNTEIEPPPDAAELIGWLNDIMERRDSNHKNFPYLADMNRLVKKYYYNRYMNDSLSIKDVVQSVLASSSLLRKKYSAPYNSTNFNDIIWWQRDERTQMVKNPYDILRGQQKKGKVGSGADAMVQYGQFLTGALDDKKNAVFDALLKYCELDTLAMVMIYEHWKSKQP